MLKKLKVKCILSASLSFYTLQAPPTLDFARPTLNFEEQLSQLEESANRIVEKSLHQGAYYIGAGSCFITAGSLLIYGLTNKDAGFNRKTGFFVGTACTFAALGTTLVVRPDLFQKKDS
jgi:hypothetical protein